jgi:hypothetical protein
LIDRSPYDCLSQNRAYKYLAPYLKNNGKKLFDELAEENLYLYKGKITGNIST